MQRIGTAGQSTGLSDELMEANAVAVLPVLPKDQLVPNTATVLFYYHSGS